MFTEDMIVAASQIVSMAWLCRKDLCLLEREESKSFMAKLECHKANEGSDFHIIAIQEKSRIF
jgi:hypothetical protein